MEREISIHRALAQLKTTTARIDDLIRHGEYVDVTVGKSGIASGKSLDARRAELISNYDAVTKLIKNFEAIKTAIIRANSGVNAGSEVETVKILDKNMTMSEMLCIHSHVIPLYQKLLAVMTSQFSRATNKVESSQNYASEKLTQMIAQMSSANSEEKLSKETIDQISAAYRENNCTSLVDPIDINSKINELKKYIEDFEEACDATLSEQNSIKKITIDFDD